MKSSTRNALKLTALSAAFVAAALATPMAMAADPAADQQMKPMQPSSPTAPATPQDHPQMVVKKEHPGSGPDTSHTRIISKKDAKKQGTAGGSGVGGNSQTGDGTGGNESSGGN
jgi:hypothetical protein